MANPIWITLPLEPFELTVPEEPGELIHARPNGRLMNHFRFSEGGSRILDVVTTTRTLFSSEMLPDTRISFQIRPTEIGIRLNQITTEWIDVIGVTSERTMELDLQALPASADTLNGKPTLRG
jgi:hypothetical protein